MNEVARVAGATKHEPALDHASPKVFEGHWKADGTAHAHAPKWAKYRAEAVSEFPLPYRGGKDPLAEQIGKFVAKLDMLRPEKGGPAYLGDSAALTWTYPEVKDVKINQEKGDLDGVLDEVVQMFNGLGNWGSPLTMCNVLPQGNTAAILASMMAQVFAPSLIEGEYSWNVQRAELETAGMLANLIGWEPQQAGGVFTWGGSGCWTYGVKYGLTRVLPDSRTKGIRTDAKIICSQQAHYCQENCSDWSGLGMDNVIRVKTDIATNQMDVVDLERILKELTASKTPVAVVVCTMGTTDSSCFDPIAKVRALLDRYPNPAGFGKTVLYADAVVGWSWIYFRDYDFANNPLGFSERILPILKQNGQAMAEIEHADCVGIDFHKVGFAPYVSSCFLYKDAAEFEGLHRRGQDAYLQVRTPYNPMYYTLEVSRTAGGALAAWATMKYFGMSGFQALLGGILETKYYLYDLLDEQQDMVCVNAEDTGLINLYRVYPKGVDAKAQYAKELKNPGGRADLVQNNHLTEAVGNLMFEWYRTGEKIDGQYTPWMSFSTGFRVTEYNRDENDSEEVVFALKSFPMNPFVTPEIMKHTIRCVHAARDEVMKTRKLAAA
jgi:glutamate/tyrosine decarboxylase-like PLP-dependent enzyme